MQLQNNIKLNNLVYTTKRGKSYKFSRYSSLYLKFSKRYTKGKFVTRR